MQLKLRFMGILLAGLMLVIALPLTASADAPPGSNAVTATATVSQSSSGTITPIPAGPGSPFGGLSIDDETFGGSFLACKGANCWTDLNGKALSITQDATLLFSGLPSPTGRVKFHGTVSGSFSIGGGTDTAAGTYSGLVNGWLQVTGPGFSGVVLALDEGKWNVTSASGTLGSLDGATGSLSARISGSFPGGESGTVTLNGTK